MAAPLQTSGPQGPPWVNIFPYAIWKTHNGQIRPVFVSMFWDPGFPNSLSPPKGLQILTQFFHPPWQGWVMWVQGRVPTWMSVR
jgi:hypothetical protein